MSRETDASQEQGRTMTHETFEELRQLRENCEFWTADTCLLNAINGKLPLVHKLEDYQAPG